MSTMKEKPLTEIEEWNFLHDGTRWLHTVLRGNKYIIFNLQDSDLGKEEKEEEKEEEMSSNPLSYDCRTSGKVLVKRS